jgi:zinc transporter ZupT
LKSPLRTEDVRPPKFAQLIGLAFALVAVIGAVAGSSVVFSVAIAAALAAAFLNAAFDFCLGCQVYLLLARLRSN